MCSFQILVQNNSGYVVFCPGCQRIQMAFYTTLVKMELDGFRQMKEHIALECLYRQPCEKPDLKQIILNLSEDTMFCLTFHELELLDHMLSEAGALLEAYQILEQQQ